MSAIDSPDSPRIPTRLPGKPIDQVDGEEGYSGRDDQPPPAGERRQGDGNDGYDYYPYDYYSDYYDYYYRYGYYGYYGHYPYYSSFYGPFSYYYQPYAYVGRAGRADRAGMGALDLNVKPKSAEVFVDGNPVGSVDQYDGFPNYLWLEPGTYNLSFYKEGFQTFSRDYTVHAEVILDVAERLQPGEAVRPEELVPGGFSWRQADGVPGTQPRGDAVIGRLQLSILPVDTAIYLDGQFLGTGEELAQLSAGLIVEPGDHLLELVRPGYVTEELPVSVPSGDRIDVSMELHRR